MLSRGVFENELVGPEVVGRILPDPFQCGQEFLLAFGQCLESCAEVLLVGRGVVDHKVDRFDDASVFIDVAVDQFRSTSIFLEQSLPHQLDPQPREMQILPDAIVGFLILADQIGFVIRQKVAAATEKVLARESEAQQQRGNQQSAGIFHVRLASSSFFWS